MSTIMKIIHNVAKIKNRNKISHLNSVIIMQKCRQFHNNTKLCIKMFMEHENKYAYNIMENKGYAINLSVKGNDTLLHKEQFEKLLQVDWTKKTPQQLFEVFPKFGMYCSNYGLCISNKQFDIYIDNLTDKIKHATDKELETLFYSLMKWPETESIRTRNYIEIWVALDDECLNRLKRWSFDEMLSFVALFFMLNVTRVSDFSKKCLQRLVSKSKQLTPGQLVQTMFFIGVNRKSPFDVHNLEVHLDSNFSKFSIDELAIMSMGFFKSKTPIRNMEIISKMIDKVIENSKDIHEVSLAAILKIIRYSMKITTDDKIYRMLETLQYEVPRLSVMCNVHLALVGTATLTLHKECLNKIADNVITNMHNTRIKDLERLTLTYGTFNFIPQTKECFFNKVMNELRRPERKFEIEKYGKSFACCVSYFSLVSKHPIDLMNEVLSIDFLERTYGKQSFTYGREILTIHNTAEIFCKQVKMNRLSEKTASLLAKKYTDYVPNDEYQKQFNITEKMMLDIIKILKEHLGGNDYVVGDHILTHHQRGDIIICNDHNGLPVPVVDAFNDKQFGVLRTPPDNNIWIVLVIAGRNSIIRNCNTTTGPFTIKIKELQSLGFHATLVPWNTYSNLKTMQQKINYLSSLIKSAVLNK